MGHNEPELDGGVDPSNPVGRTIKGSQKPLVVWCDAAEKIAMLKEALLVCSALRLPTLIVLRSQVPRESNVATQYRRA